MPRPSLQFSTTFEKFLVFSFFIALSINFGYRPTHHNTKVFAQSSDTTGPVTTYVQTPSTPDGNDGWYVSDVVFDLEATDLETGVKEINYRIDSGAWQKVIFSNTTNQAPNPSFEISGATTTGAESWESTVVDPEAIISTITSDYAPGFDTTSVEITTTGGSWHGINNKSDPVLAIPYDNMSASIWVKSQNVPGVSHFKIYAILSNGSEVELATSESINGTTGWTKISESFSVPYSNVVSVYMDVGHTGPGTIYVDAVSINSSLYTTNTTVTISSDSANHRLEFYSVDNADNAETYSCNDPVKNCVEFKLDQTPPGNWADSAAIRSIGGAEHEVYVFTRVFDLISGLSTNTNQYMYNVDEEPGFGHYEDLIHCNTPWLENDWVGLEDYPSSDGITDFLLKTQKTDFCNSDWKICKEVRFYAEDVAGNNATKDFCINGPWIKVRATGAVKSNAHIDMLSEAPDEDNTDGLIEVVGNTVNFFTSSQGWKVTDSNIFGDYGYDKLSNLTPESKTQITDNKLKTVSGVYYIDGDFNITNTAIPSGFTSTTFDQIVFVNGNLTISTDISISANSTVLFVVSGNVDIAKNANNLSAGIIADGNLNTAYDVEEGKTTQTLIAKGVFSANEFIFNRTLQGANNSNTPSEEFYFEPKYLIQLKQFFNNSATLWRYDQ